MLLKLLNKAELESSNINKKRTPYKYIHNTLTMLDEAYGEDRSYEDDGGYVLFCSKKEDLVEAEKIFNFHHHPYEYSIQIENGYCCQLHVLNNEYTVSLIYPSGGMTWFNAMKAVKNN